MGHSRSLSAQPITVPFGALLRRLLLRRQVPEHKAAALAGIPARWMSSLLSDARPPSELSARKLAALLSALQATTEERRAITAAHKAPQAPRPSRVFKRHRLPG